MNATVDRNALSAAAKLASDTADPKSPQELLAQALLRFTGRDLVVAATDTTTSVMTELASAKPSRPVGSVCVDARRLSSAVASLPGGDVSVSMDDKLRVTLKAGKATVALAGRKGEDFPTLPTIPQGAEVPAAQFAAAIGRVKHVHGLDETQFPGPYLLVKGGVGKLVAVTSHRFAIAEFPAPKFDQDQPQVTVPFAGIAQIAKALDGAETASLAIAGGRLSVTTGPVSVSVRLSDSPAVDWERVLWVYGSTRRDTVKLWREELLSAARRAGMMAGSGEKLSNGINIDLADQELVIASALDGTGEASTAIALDGEEKARPERLRASWRYLADALSAIEGERVDFDYGTALEPIQLRAPGSPGLQLIMVQSREGR